MQPLGSRFEFHAPRSAELRASFEADGFVAVPGFLDLAALREVRRRLGRLLRERLPRLPREHVFFEDRERPETLKQIQRVHEHDAWFGALFERGAPRALAAELLGEPARPVNLQWFNKPPGAGKATPAHQDGFYFHLEPPAAVTLWIALDDVDESNGCVRYVRGSHRRGMRSHGATGTLGFSQGLTDFGRDGDLGDEVAVPAEAGDLLAHHALTIHRAEANRSSDRPRRALGFIYYAESAREDVRSHEAYQRRLRSEWIAGDRL